MRVLEINDVELGGGAEEVMRSTAALLQERGHSVHIFTAKKRLERRFVDLLDYVYSFRHARALKRCIEEFRPDIVHIHNFTLFLSPSVLYALGQLKKHYDFRVFATVHDWHLVCANNDNYCWSQNKACRDCQGRKFWKILQKNCDRRGYIYSLLKYAQHAVAYTWLKVHQNVDCFISPSRFLAKELEQVAPPEKIRFLPNPAFGVERQRFAEVQGSYNSVFIGRLNPGKGLERFLKNSYRPEFFGTFAIIGDGELENDLKKLIADLGFEKSVTLLGRKPKEEAMAYLAKAQRLILPSFFENCPLVALEARALGKEIFHYELAGVAGVLALSDRELSEQYYIDRLEHLFAEGSDVLCRHLQKR